MPALRREGAPGQAVPEPAAGGVPGVLPLSLLQPIAAYCSLYVWLTLHAPTGPRRRAHAALAHHRGLPVAAVRRAHRGQDGVVERAPRARGADDVAEHA